MHFSAALLALLPVALAAPAGEVLDKRAPLLAARSGQHIPGKYIIKLRENAADDILEKAIGKLRSKADHVYRGKFKGFAAHVDEDILDALRLLPEVSSHPGKRSGKNVGENMA